MGIEQTICRNRWNFPSINFANREVRTCIRYHGEFLSESDLQELGTEFVLNNPHQLRRRMDMIRGTPQVDCSGCYRLEASGSQSARGGYEDFLKYQAGVHGTSREMIAEELKDVGGSSRILKSYKPGELEVSFGNKCNLKCVYCSYDHSSQWAAELIAAGELDRKKYEQTFADRDNPDFHELFWKWYHEVARHSIQTIYTIGGEPLLSDKFYRFMDRLWEEHSDLTDRPSEKPWINIISNLTLPPEYLERLIDAIPRWLDPFNLDFNVSLESVGARAEYIRFGMDWERFDRNVDRLFGSHFEGNVRFSFLPTLCSTSISSTPEFVKYYAEKCLKFKHSITIKRNVAMFPFWQCPLILPPEFARYLTDAAAILDEFGSSYPEFHGWKDFRDYLIKNAHGIMEQRETEETRVGKANFPLQVAKLDRRRKVDFRSIFPEYVPFLETCEALASPPESN